MKKIIVLVYLFVQIVIKNHAQTTLNGFVKDGKTSKAISFASIAYKVEQIGTYCNEEGFFSLDLRNNGSINDSLIISCLGYEKKTVEVGSIKSQNNIYLIPIDLKLTELKITPNKKSKIVTKSLGTHTAKPNNVFSSGATKEGFTTVLFINNDNFKNAYVKEIIYVVEPKYQMNSSVVKIHLFEKDKYSFEPRPGREIIEDNLFITIPPKTKKIKVDVQKYAIPLPNEGIFVGLEWVKGNVSKSFSFQGIVLAPVIRSTYEVQSTYAYNRFMGQDWKKGKLRAFTGGTSSPMLGINILVEKE